MPLTGRLPQPTPEEAEQARLSRTLLGMITGHWVAQTVRAGTQLRITDHVAAGAQTAKEVAALESSDAGATFRLMRAMASLGLLNDGGRDTFLPSPLGELLRQDVPGSLRAAALARRGPALWQSMGLLPEAVRSGETQSMRAIGGSIFEYFSSHEEEGQIFSQAMSDLTRQVAEDVVTLLDLGSASRVADIGGANGALVLTLMRAHARITGLVFDLPHVVPLAQAAAEKSGLSERFTAVAGNFFDSAPEADYYLLKWILHDWTDQECLRILRNCRVAGGRGARMLIIEALIGDTGESAPVALFDMNMLAATKGKQRSLEELVELFTASGWRLAATAPTRSIDSLLELEAV